MSSSDIVGWVTLAAVLGGILWGRRRGRQARADAYAKAYNEGKIEGSAEATALALNRIVVQLGGVHVGNGTSISAEQVVDNDTGDAAIDRRIRELLAVRNGPWLTEPDGVGGVLGGVQRRPHEIERHRGVVVARDRELRRATRDGDSTAWDVTGETG